MGQRPAHLDGEGRVFGLTETFQRFSETLSASLTAIDLNDPAAVNSEFAHQSNIKRDWMMYRGLVDRDKATKPGFGWDSCHNLKMDGRCTLTILDAGRVGRYIVATL